MASTPALLASVQHWAVWFMIIVCIKENSQGDIPPSPCGKNTNRTATYSRNSGIFGDKRRGREEKGWAREGPNETGNAPAPAERGGFLREPRPAGPGAESLGLPGWNGDHRGGERPPPAWDEGGRGQQPEPNSGEASRVLGENAEGWRRHAGAPRGPAGTRGVQGEPGRRGGTRKAPQPSRCAEWERWWGELKG